MIVWAPSRPSASAVARPIPALAAEMRAVFPTELQVHGFSLIRVVSDGLAAVDDHRVSDDE